MLGSPESTDEIAQVAFHAVWRGAHAYRVGTVKTRVRLGMTKLGERVSAKRRA